MRKLTIIFIAVMLSFTAMAQKPIDPKKDSMVLQITIDTIQFKQIVQLIQENVNPNTLTGKMVLQNILQPLYKNARLVPIQKTEAIKPKK